MEQAVETEPFEWDDRFLLGFQPMDDTHREFVSLVGEMLHCSASAFPAALEAFAQHAIEHFELERSLMATYDFPAMGCHVEEHDKVLESVQAVQARVKEGNIELGRQLAQALADWFPGHADYMDASLSTWLVKKTCNGAPLVLRRTKPRS